MFMGICVSCSGVSAMRSHPFPHFGDTTPASNCCEIIICTGVQTFRSRDELRMAKSCIYTLFPRHEVKRTILREASPRSCCTTDTVSTHQIPTITVSAFHFWVFFFEMISFLVGSRLAKDGKRWWTGLSKWAA